MCPRHASEQYNCTRVSFSLTPGCKLKLKLYVVYWKSVASMNSPWLRVIVPLITPPSK